MTEALKILVVDDDDGDRQQIRRALLGGGLPFEFTGVTSLEEATQACERAAFDFVFVDYCLPGSDGLSGIAALHARWPYMAVIMSTGQGDEAVAVEAMKRGAADYIQKRQINPQAIRHIIENAMEKAELRKQVDSQREELETFAHVLAHDLKAPAGSIVTLARFIEQDIDAGKLADAVANSRHIVRAASRSMALIDAVYQFTRLNAKFALQPTETQRVLQDTLSDLAEVTKPLGARVTHGVLPAVRGDATLIRQLLQNLIGNAVKFCAAGAPSVHVAAIPDDDMWLFSVTDNGIGIPEKYYRKIFTQFERLHSQDKYEGSGLGLSTCKKIVELHGGRIWCDSTVGVGTTFYFTLPAAV